MRNQRIPEGLDRRTFMKTAAAATVAASVAPWHVASAATAPLAGRAKKSVIYNMFQSNAPVVDKYKILREVGFEGLEIRFRDPEDPDEMRRASEEAELPIHSVMLGSVDNIDGAVDLATAVGATAVLLVAGRVNENMPYKENYERTQAVIRDALPYAEEKEVHLLVENVWNNFLLSPLEMARYVDELDSPYAGAYFDVGNVVRFAYPEHWIPVLGERIKRVHIKEYCREKQNNEGLWKGFDVELGEGSIDWEAVRREFVAIDYNGWITAEVSGGGKERMQEISDRMDSVLAL